MRVPTADYSSQQSALSNKYNAKQGAILSKQIALQTSSADIANKSLQLSEKSMALTEKSLANQTSLIQAQSEYYKSMSTLNKLNFGISAIEKVYSLVNEASASKAKTDLLNYQGENQKRLAESALNGKSYIKYNDNGELEVVYDPDYIAWQESAYAEVKSKHYTAEVENSMLASLQSMFASSEGTILDTLAKSSASEIQFEYQNLMDTAMENDVNAVSLDDVFNTSIPESDKYAQGYKLIDSKNLTDAEKTKQKAEYRLATDKKRAEKLVSDTTVSSGKDAGIELAEKFRDLYGLDDASVQHLVDIAEGKATVLKTEKMGTAAQFMTEALNNGESPDQIYSALNREMEGMPAEYKNAMMESATNAHITWATADVNKRISGYSSSKSIDEIVVMMKDLTDNADKYKGGAESVYQTGLAKLNSYAVLTFGEVITTNAVENADTLVSVYKSKQSEMEGIKTTFLNGEMSAYEAIAEIRNTQYTVKSLYNEVELARLQQNNPGLYTEIMNVDAKATTFINDIIDATTKDKSDLKDYYNNWYKGVTSYISNVYKGDEAKISEAQIKLEASFVDLLREQSKGELSIDVVAKRLDDMKNIFVADTYEQLADSEIPGYQDPKAGTPATYNSKSVKTALEKLNLFATKSGAAYGVQEGLNGESSIEWLDNQFETTVNQAAGTIRDNLKDVFGAGDVKINLTTNRSEKALDSSGNPIDSVSEIPLATFTTSQPKLDKNGNKILDNRGEVVNEEATYQVVSNGDVYKKVKHSEGDKSYFSWVKTDINLLDRQYSIEKEEKKKEKAAKREMWFNPNEH